VPIAVALPGDFPGAPRSGLRTIVIRGTVVTAPPGLLTNGAKVFDRVELVLSGDLGVQIGVFGVLG
jgi:hypothetical protein